MFFAIRNERPVIVVFRYMVEKVMILAFSNSVIEDSGSIKAVISISILSPKKVTGMLSLLGFKSLTKILILIGHSEDCEPITR